MKHPVKGFTVIEALVTMVIISILASIAYPSYVSQMRKSIRVDATTELMTLAQAQERFFAQFRTYSPLVSAPEACAGQACGLGMRSSLSESGYYQLSSKASATSYTLTATANGPQIKDSDCRRMTIDSFGIKKATDASNEDSTDICW